jgi:hypothetical protein
LLSGCLNTATVSSDLPLQRVVVYRNGVAYFERAGHVSKSEIRFKMKEGAIGDFLATLAVLEQGGSSVKSAAFPLDVDKDDAKPRSLMSSDEKRGLRKVAVSLDGDEHDLLLGYVTAAPVWRPSYRVVVLPNGQAELQAWGIVQNLSGEDWRDVRLSLVAGAPIAFQADLGRAVIPPRPMITDEGEVIAAVPVGETSLAQPTTERAAAEIAEDEPMAPPEAGDDDGLLGGAAVGRASASGARAPTKKSRRSGGMPSPAAPPPPSMAPRRTTALAAMAVQAGTTRYDIGSPVTVPDNSATMVLLLSNRVKGESLFLFAPDGGVPDSASHPFRVVRFGNETKGILEKGPIAVFESNAFLGQGLLDPLPAGATATVPFALDRAVAVRHESKSDQLGARLYRIDGGNLWIERDSVQKTTYKIQNGGDAAIKLMVKHHRNPAAKLFEPPEGTDDNLATASALVPTRVEAKSSGELTIDERQTVQQYEDWFSVYAERAIASYISHPDSDRATVDKLRELLRLRKDILKHRETKWKLDRERSEHERSTEETRKNLRAIEKGKDPETEKLRKKLTLRLNDAVSRLDDLNRQTVSASVKLSELEIAFKDLSREIRVTDPRK